MDYYSGKVTSRYSTKDNNSVAQMYTVLDNPTLMKPYEVTLVKDLIAFAQLNSEITIIVRNSNIHILFTPDQSRYDNLTNFTRQESILLLDNDCISNGQHRYMVIRKYPEPESVDTE